MYLYTYLHHIQPGHLLLKVDFRNAFNCIRRDKILHAVLKYAPGIYQFVHAAHSQASLLFFGNHIIDSTKGRATRRSTGPLLFSLTIQPMLLALKSKFKIFYLDDSTVGGTLEEVVSDLKMIEQFGEELSLVLNHSKSEVICAEDNTRRSILAVSPHLQCIEPADACLLGSPIGGSQSTTKVLSSKKQALELMGERLKLLHSHDALCLLKNALALPKILYILHTAPCFGSPILANLDRVQKSLLEKSAMLPYAKCSGLRPPCLSGQVASALGSLPCWLPLHFSHQLLVPLPCQGQSCRHP